MDEQHYIICPRCGWKSHNPNDVRNRYCGNCHAYHDMTIPYKEYAEYRKKTRAAWAFRRSLGDMLCVLCCRDFFTADRDDVFCSADCREKWERDQDEKSRRARVWSSIDLFNKSGGC